MREQTVIPILRRNSAIYGVGGGITWDTKWESEYQETKQKSAVLYRQEPRFELLTTGCIHQGELTFLEQHLTRLREASRYFAYPYDEPKLLQKGRYQEIADGGHLLNTEKPYELAQAIKEFVAGF